MKFKFSIISVLFFYSYAQAAAPFTSGQYVCANRSYKLAIQAVDGVGSPEVRQLPVDYSFLYPNDAASRISYFLNRFCDASKGFTNLSAQDFNSSNLDFAMCCISK